MKNKIITLKDFENILMEKEYIKFKRKFDTLASPCTYVDYKFNDDSGNLRLFFPWFDIYNIPEKDGFLKNLNLLDKEKGLCSGYVHLTPPFPFSHYREGEFIPFLQKVSKKYSLGIRKHLADSVMLGRGIYNGIEEILKGVKDVREAYFFLKQIAKKLPELVNQYIKEN